MISPIDSWYVIFDSLEVDRVFFDKIDIDLAEIGRRERRSLHL